MPIRQTLLFLLCVSVFMSDAWSQMQVVNTSMNNINLTVVLDDKGVLQYAVLFNGKQVVRPSRLGFKLKDGIALDSNFELVKLDSITVDETWNPVWGEVNKIRNHYKQIIC